MSANHSFNFMENTYFELIFINSISKNSRESQNNNSYEWHNFGSMLIASVSHYL